MKKITIICATVLLGFVAFAQERSGMERRMRENPDAKLHRFSTTVEKERPQLNDETKRLIAAYHRNPSEENRAALRKQCAINYDKIVERKKAKLEELKHTAKHQSKVDEMQDIVDEMIANREHRIDQTMARFTDSRFRGHNQNTGYLPLLGAARNVSVAYAPVTNEDYAKFTGKPVAAGTEKRPVTNVSVEDAAKYCKWLGERDPKHAYRLPTEEEWELAAGHMPKDADFNCGVGDVVRPVDAFAQTKGASGGIDFWGNCWEWTATKRGEGKNAVKGGAFDSKRTDCRTEAKNTAKDTSKGYPNVTMRLVREECNAHHL
ncbi:MAG: SUMF1/EgtB/PvdO family nonheme iron enzyme [Kiritimatiellae bacterium]|nr:SUMF1/EgtB/PvdO family nonheme iron enzyme [Kiritimatiellia bacterium]